MALKPLIRISFVLLSLLPLLLLVAVEARTPPWVHVILPPFSGVGEGVPGEGRPHHMRFDIVRRFGDGSLFIYFLWRVWFN